MTPHDRLIVDRAVLRARAALWLEISGTGMTTDQVPSETEVVDGRPVLDAGPLGGPAFTINFARYLERKGSPMLPVQRALLNVRRKCRGGHSDHTASGVLDDRGRDTWYGSMCHRLLILTLYWSKPVTEAAAELGIYEDQAYRIVRNRIMEIFQQLEAVRGAPSEKAEPDVFTPSRLSRAICDALQREVRDFDLEQRIWEAFRHRDPTLPAWDVEWGRRQARLLEHRATCERCRFEAAA